MPAIPELFESPEVSPGNSTPGVAPTFSATDDELLGFISTQRPDFRHYFEGSLGEWAGVTGEQGLLGWARAHLGSGHDRDQFEAYRVQNAVGEAFPGAVNGAGGGGGEAPGAFGGFEDLLGPLLALLGSSRGDTTTTVDVSPVTNTTVTNTLTVNQSGVSEEGFLGVIQSFENTVSRFFNRLPELWSVPANADVVSPAPVPYGYAQNMDQSTQRGSGQTVATVRGFEFPGGAAGFSVGQIAVLVIAGVLVAWLVGRFIK